MENNEPDSLYIFRPREPPMNSTKLAILITFLSILVKGKVHYCEPRPNTTLELLKKFHSISIGRRWFFQCMLDLETAGYVRRRRRWNKLPGPQIESNSSLWWFTIKGAKFMASKMIRGARELLHIMTDWLHKDDNRTPALKDLTGNEDITDRAAAIKKIKEILKGIG